MVVLPSMSTSQVLNPTEEKTRNLSVSFTLIVYSPLLLVVVPVFGAFFTCTDTDASGLPVSFLTVPVMVVCARPPAITQNIPITSKRRCLEKKNFQGSTAYGYRELLP